MSIDLSRYDNSWYSPGRSVAWQAAWFFVGSPILRCSVLPSSRIRVGLLRLFGARIGVGVVIKPGLRIKYPWRLRVGNYCWLGESAWIDNITDVTLHDNVCLSQEAYLCTGNHDWTDPTFGLILKPIELKSGSWVGARAVLLPGVVLEPGAIAAAGSVVQKSIPAFEIHGGNPAAYIRMRLMRNQDIRVYSSLK